MGTPDYNGLSEEDLASFSDMEILDFYDTARAVVSHYNAAEGSVYREEARSRQKAITWMYSVEKELKERDLVPNPGEYLL